MDKITLANTKEAKFFHENGFVGPIKLYDPEVARELLAEIRIKNLDKSKAIFDNEVNYDRHFDIPELSRHISHPEIIRVLRSILGNNLLCWRTEFFPKFPGSKGTEWHQVETYEYASGSPQIMPTEIHENIPHDLTVWTAFTDATKENGCMKFLPGSHKKKYYDESKTPTTGRSSTYQSVAAETSFFGYNFSDFKVDPNWEPDENEAVALEMQAGECVIFTAMCVHASFPNTSKRSTRFAISSRYVPTHVRIYPNQEEMNIHGGHFNLNNHGCVLVSGKDNYNHNRIKNTNALGEQFTLVV